MKKLLALLLVFTVTLPYLGSKCTESAIPFTERPIRRTIITSSMSVPPVADFTADHTIVCPNDTVSFADLSSNSPSSWSWSFTPSTVSFVNSTSANSRHPQVQFHAPGSYQVSLTATNAAGSDTEVKTAYITADSVVTPSVSISTADTSICSGNTAHFTANTINGGVAPVYQWKVNGNNVGVNSPAFSSSSLDNNDVVTVELTSGESCASPATVISNAVNMSVSNPVTPTVGITVTSILICNGDTAHFTAIPTNGGQTPSYQWKVNGTNTGSNSPYFSSSTLANNDTVSVEMTSDDSCATTATATSNNLKMIVRPNVTPSVEVTTYDSIACAGSPVSFTANSVNAGSSPTYEWKRNGQPLMGITTSTFTAFNLNDSDQVSVTLVSSDACAIPDTVTSAPLVIRIAPRPQITFNMTVPGAPLCPGDTLKLSASANSFGYNGIGHWTGPGVKGGKFIASDAGPGTHTLYYGYALMDFPCFSSDTIAVTVENLPKPTISANGLILTCSESGLTYQWIRNGSPIAGANGRSYVVTANGSYSVEISSSNCAYESDPMNITYFGTEEIQAALNFKLYPNPTTGKFAFELRNPGASEAIYEITAFNGAVILRKSLPAGAVIKERVDLAEYASGMYALCVRVGDLRITEKIHKQ